MVLTLWTAEGTGIQQELVTQQEDPRLSGCTNCRVQSPGMLLLGVPPQRHQVKLFLCHCTTIKLLRGSRHLRLLWEARG